ncbi:hypothetical protein AHAS_Ahas11G0126500 [Arachis hypogaea]
MASRGQGQSHMRRDYEGNPTTDNHAELVAAMTNLVNIIQVSTAMTTHAMRRTRQSSKNENGEGAENNLGGVLRTLDAFLKVDPPIFNGSTNPTEADNWFQAMERALRTQHVPYDHFVEYAAYQLAAFYKKYFHKPIREARELEFLRLKQGSMTVAEYTSKFEELCRFSKISQGAPESYEG